MSLITVNSISERFNASSDNLNFILNLKETPKSNHVVTEVSRECFKEIQNTRLGWGHFIKKFFSTSITYASILALPVVTLAGSIWYYFDQIKNLPAIYDIKNLALGGSGLGAVFLANFAIGKVFGVRPMTAIMFAAYDTYRGGAKALSNQVRDSYTRHEERTEELVRENRKTIEDQLKSTYFGIANELAKRYENGKLGEEIKILKTNLPLIARELINIGLTPAKTLEILSPLKTTVDLIEKSKKIHRVSF